MKKIETIHPEVSVALCTYNGERFLHEQLESILCQDYVNITEIVCVDDNSSDGTWDVLKEYASKHKIFRIYQNKLNLGFNGNFEKAIALTTKQYIAIADQDDIWYSNKISKLIGAIKNNLMVYSDNEYIDAEGKALGLKFSDKRNLTLATSCLNFALFNVISGHTILLNRKLLEHALPFSKDIPYDYWFAFHASQYGNIPYVNEPLVGYRQHETNAIGAMGYQNKAKNKNSLTPTNESQLRIQIFKKNLAPNLIKEHKVLNILGKSYTDRSVIMKLTRVALFWENRNALLLFKKRNKIRKMFYCVKVFWKYD